MKIKYILFSIFLVTVFSCDTDVYNPNATYPDQYVPIESGDADFSTYVSMGESITAGFSDNSLFAAAQMNSYPNIMAGIMSEAGGGVFTQPYVNDNVGGINVGGEQFWGPRFYFDGAGPDFVSGNPTTEATNVVPGPYSNMAFPFANAITFVAPGVGSLEGLAAGLANPWYVRAASSNNATMIGDVLAQQPTFVTLVPGHDFANYGLFGASGQPFGPLELEGATGMLAGVIGTIQALSANVPNGVITTLPDPTNTATFRCHHRTPNLGQVPSDERFRRLFIATPGQRMVAADLSGIELRMLAHYLGRYDGGRYADILLNDDIHQVNADKIGITRRQVKTVTYAFLYGAGNEKIGMSYDNSLQPKEARKKGSEIREAFVSAIEGLSDLLGAVAAKSANGFLLACDGRRVLVDSPHKALNYLLQCSAGVIAKRWMVIADDNLNPITYSF